MKMIAYTRVSSKGQEDNTSLDNQYRRIQAYCDFAGYELVAHYSDAVTANGQRKRPAFESALAAVYAGEADGIICLALDRFARSVLEGLRIVSELNEHGKQLVIIDLRLDTTEPIGEAVLTILLALAQLERKTTKKRCDQGRAIKIERGEYHGGRPPYGWDAIGKTLVENPVEQKWRRYIVEKGQQGETAYAIANELNRLGVPNKSGKPWKYGAVHKILNAPPKHPCIVRSIEDGNCAADRERAS
jgi:site-specific DNA recombinase